MTPPPRRGRALDARTTLVAVNAAGIVALLVGFHASNRYKACEEARTRQVFLQQYVATTDAVTMALTWAQRPAEKPGSREPRDYADSVYILFQRAQKSRARFERFLNDESCAPWDRAWQAGIFVSAGVQIVSALLSVLLNKRAS